MNFICDDPPNNLNYKTRTPIWIENNVCALYIFLQVGKNRLHNQHIFSYTRASTQEMYDDDDENETHTHNYKINEKIFSYIILSIRFVCVCAGVGHIITPWKRMKTQTNLNPEMFFFILLIYYIIVCLVARTI